MIIDHHFYFDEKYYNIEDINSIFKKNNINCGVISPSCTIDTEPEKSEIMYLLQRKLITNYFGYEICKIISKSFYNKNEELRSFWKLFSNNKKLNKVVEPDNEMIFNSIKNIDNLSMWYWINPQNKNNINHSEKIKKFKNKIKGIKFHQYWHNFELEQIYIYSDIIKEYDFPIYLLLNYEEQSKIINFLDSFSQSKILIGYAGFPNFKKLWNIIKDYQNVYIDIASNHIDSKIIKNLTKKINSSQIIFASDFPYNFKDKNNEFQYSKLFDRLNFLSTAEKEKILQNTL